MITVYKKNEFIKRFESFLYEDEITNNLMIGLANRSVSDEDYFVSSEKDSELLLGLISGKNLVLATNSMSDDVYKELVLHMESMDYPGIIGPKDVCLKYSELYHELTGKSMNIEMDQRIYSCRKTSGFSEPVGYVRLARLSDLDLLADWVLAFQRDIENDAEREDIYKRTKVKILNELIYVLELDSKVVSMAAKSRPLQSCMTVSLVFTPKELRGRGYASRVVEEVTNIILEEKEMATLYTDMSNPTSNSIYMKIGYEKHCDSIMMGIKKDF